MIEARTQEVRTQALSKGEKVIQETIDDLKKIHDGDAWHGPSLKEILEGVTAAQAAVRPLPGAHSIWEIVLHIAGWEDVFRNRLEGRATSAPEDGDFPPVTDQSEAAWQKALARLDESHRRLIETIAGVKEFQATVPGKDYTVAYLIRNLGTHHVYHAGQIMLLKKAV